MSEQEPTFSVREFEQYQHYRDRDPPWVKLHRNILTGRTWIKGTDLSRCLQLASTLLAARYSNAIPLDFDMLQPVLALKCSEAEFMAAIRYLEAAEFIKINGVADCYQDASTPLAKCSPEKSRGETEAETEGERERGRASVTRSRSRQPKGTRLANDWSPSAEDRAYAAERNLTDAEIDGVAEQFRDYWHSPDAKNPVKRDWPGTWRRWVARDAERIIANRARRNGHGAHGSRTGSIVDAVARLKARAGGTGEAQRAGGVRDDAGGLETASDDAGSSSGSDGIGGEILSPDGTPRGYRAAGRTEADDDMPTGAGTGPGSAACALRQEADRVAVRRGAQSPDDAIRTIEMVADVGGTARAIDAARWAAQAPCGDLEIPQFLRRA